MLSVVCSTRFRITPMRSSNDCCMRAICSCSACTWVCNWIMSLFAANAGSDAPATKNNAHVRMNDFFIGFRLDAELLLGVEIGSPVQVREVQSQSGRNNAAGEWLPRAGGGTYLVSTKCARRFCCQHASFDSLQNGFSFP